MPAKALRILLLFVFVPALLFGQGWRWRGQHRNDGDERNGVPTWEQEGDLTGDVFTFARVRYSSFWGRSRWRTDFPDSDLNFSYRLQQLTSLEVDPDGVIVDLTDEDFRNYPFLYMIEVGSLEFEEAEVENLRDYLLGGGFLMVDDFWGEDEWYQFEHEIRRVFPDRPIEDLPRDHEIFNIVFDVQDQRLQVPSIENALRGRSRGITWEREDARDPHYRAIFDDAGRMMVMICHNTDLGDGWEREGLDRWYFKEFSEKSAYPLGINILFYAFTH